MQKYTKVTSELTRRLHNPSKYWNQNEQNQLSGVATIEIRYKIVIVLKSGMRDCLSRQGLNKPYIQTSNT